MATRRWTVVDLHQSVLRQRLRALIMSERQLVCVPPTNHAADKMANCGYGAGYHYDERNLPRETRVEL